MPYIFYLPSYAATAWYHKVLKDRPADVVAFIDEARKFAGSEYSSALMKGSKLTSAEKADMAKKLSRYTGLTEDYLIKANLASPSVSSWRNCSAIAASHRPPRFPLFRFNL